MFSETRNYFYLCLQYLIFLAFFDVQANVCMKREIFTLVAKDHRLKNYVTHETPVFTLQECSQICLFKRQHCRSINFEKKKTPARCQLSSQTREYKPEDLVLDSGFNYYEPIKVRRILYPSQSAIISEGTYRVKNVWTKRLLFLGSNKILGSDANYYNRANWKIKKNKEGKYTIWNNVAKRYLSTSGDEIPGDGGCENGAAEAPLCLPSEDQDDPRNLWRIIEHQNGKYFIVSVVNFRYVLSQGEPPTRSEGGWLRSPRCAMSDANYENRALWELRRI